MAIRDFVKGDYVMYEYQNGRSELCKVKYVNSTDVTLVLKTINIDGYGSSNALAFKKKCTLITKENNPEYFI